MVFGHSSILSIALLAITFVSASLSARVSVEKSGNRTTYAFHIDAIDFEKVTIETQEFLKPKLRGVSGYDGVVFELGRPELPVLRFFVEGEGPIQVESTVPALDSDNTMDLPLKPAIPSVPKIEGAKPHLVFAPAAKADEYEPVRSYSIDEAGRARGVRQRLVTLFPMHYDPVKKTYSQADDFRVVFTRTDPESSSFRAPKERETLAFVVGPRFESSAALKKLIAFKRSLGFLPRLILVGKDAKTPAEIRAKLQALFRDAAHPLAAALLVGDAQEVPSYPSSVIRGVTDHYYRVLAAADYEANIGSPDIEVGRLVVSSESALGVVVDKQVRYETGVFSDDKWLGQFSFIASDDSTYWKVAEDSFNYLVDSHTGPLGFKGFFPLLGQKGGDLLYAVTHHATGPLAVQEMKRGRGFINYGGHGGIGYWASPRVDKADVQALSDPNAIPLVIANACITGQFTSASFGEAWQAHPQGSIIYWGSMDSTYWDEDDILQRRTYDSMFRDRQWEFGKFSEAGLKEVWRYYGGAGRSRYYYETYVTFGDPLTHVRTAATQGVRVEGASVKTVGDSRVTYRVIDEKGRPLSGVRVAVVSQTLDYAATAVSDPQGSVSLLLAEGTGTPGSTFGVTASGDNLRLWTGTLEYRK